MHNGVINILVFVYSRESRSYGVNNAVNLQERERKKKKREQQFEAKEKSEPKPIFSQPRKISVSQMLLLINE